jgi:succinate dehydrogenase/fumarate reductase flavoprotein subunit
VNGNFASPLPGHDLRFGHGFETSDILLRGGTAAAALASASLATPSEVLAQSARPPLLWQQTADVIVIGSGAAGLPASIVAKEAGSSVVLIEAEKDIGGHAITSGRNVPLGGGTSLRKKYGVNDSPDLLFRDLTDWSVVEPNGFPDYRYNDREIIRAFADNSAPTYEWLVKHGVVFVDKAPDETSVGNSVPREAHSAVMNWPMVQTGKPADPAIAPLTSSGNGLMRPLEAAAKKAGVQLLLQHKMVGLYRQSPNGGRVTGVVVIDNIGKTPWARSRQWAWGIALGMRSQKCVNCL